MRRSEGQILQDTRREGVAKYPPSALGCIPIAILLSLSGLQQVQGVVPPSGGGGGTPEDVPLEIPTHPQECRWLHRFGVE